MTYKEITLKEAIQDFRENVFPGLFEGERKPDNKKYKWVYSILMDDEKFEVSETRAKKLLEKYGGDRYRVNTSFEVMIDESPSCYADNSKGWEVSR